MLCFCYVFALQQLILYFLMVFVANSLQIACISSFLQAICNKNIEKIKKHKLFASYLQQKPSKSIELAAAKQKHSKPSSKNCIFLILSTIQNFAMFFCYVKTFALQFCYVFAMFFLLCQNICSAVLLCFCFAVLLCQNICSAVLLCFFAMSIICSAVLLCFCYVFFAMSKHLLCSFAMFLLCSFAM